MVVDAVVQASVSPHVKDREGVRLCSLFCTGQPSIPQMRNCQTPNGTSVPWGNTGQSPIPWPRMHRGTRHFIGHPEEELMMLRECAVQGEDAEGGQAFKLKIYSNEMRSRKQCGRNLTSPENLVSWTPIRSQGRDAGLTLRNKGTRLFSLDSTSVY